MKFLSVILLAAVVCGETAMAADVYNCEGGLVVSIAGDELAIKTITGVSQNFQYASSPILWNVGRTDRFKSPTTGVNVYLKLGMRVSSATGEIYFVTNNGEGGPVVDGRNCNLAN